MARFAFRFVGHERQNEVDLVLLEVLQQPPLTAAFTAKRKFGHRT